jgi:hypothetical protein
MCVIYVGPRHSGLIPNPWLKTWLKREQLGLFKHDLSQGSDAALIIVSRGSMRRTTKQSWLKTWLKMRHLCWDPRAHNKHRIKPGSRDAMSMHSHDQGQEHVGKKRCLKVGKKRWQCDIVPLVTIQTHDTLALSAALTEPGATAAAGIGSSAVTAAGGATAAAGMNSASGTAPRRRLLPTVANLVLVTMPLAGSRPLPPLAGSSRPLPRDARLSSAAASRARP